MKIAVINTPYATHIGRMAYVFAELKCQGHEVELWGNGATRAVAERHGMVYREIPLQTDFTQVMQRRLKPHEVFNDLFFSIAKEQLRTVLDFCEEYSPDVIEANARVFSATVASKLTGIPVVTHCCSGNSFSQLPEDLYGFCVKGTESRREQTIMLKLSAEFFSRTDRWFNENIAGPFGLGKIENAIGLCAPEYAIAQTIPELSKKRIAELPNVHMTGPIVTEDSAPMDFSHCQPYCYVSLGTSPWNTSEILERYRKIVQYTPANLNMVIGLGALAEKAQLSIDDERVLVLENAPQLEAIKHSELVICHGGCQTVHEALYFGKPLIGIPHHAEISEMVNSVEINGAGVRVAPSKISRGTLGEAIETATSEDTRGHAARLAAALGHADGQRNILALFARIESRISHT